MLANGNSLTGKGGVGGGGGGLKVRFAQGVM